MSDVPVAALPVAWILAYTVPYESDRVLGVFSSAERAKAAAGADEGSWHGSDETGWWLPDGATGAGWDVRAWTVDTAVDDR